MSTSHPAIEEAEVAVVGAGPAGAAAALRLAQLGREVVLVDQSEFPRDKPCGDALWSSAVDSFRELGLADSMEEAPPIEGTRVIRNGISDPIVTRAARDDGASMPRCIPRFKVDAALFDAALAAGARFVLGRVQETIENDGLVEAAIVHGTHGSRGEVRAKSFIAADGATSRLRRLSGIGGPAFGANAYAVRQYFRVEKSVNPIFDIRIPLRYGRQLLPGYGWIFPVAPDIVNVGVGFFQAETSLSPEISIRAVLDSFINDLRSDSRAEFGDFESVSKPFGAPVAIGFEASAAKRGNMLFVGDAARMTDPLIGEGIASALRSGIEAAREIDDSLKRGWRSDFGTRLLDGFPRLGQDTRIVLRAYSGLVADAGPSDGDASRNRAGHPLLTDVATMLMRGADDIPTLLKTPAVQLASSGDSRAGEVLADFDDRVLETLRTEFPFARELMHRELRSGAGPTRAVTVIVAASLCGGEMDSSAIQGAISLELLAMTTHFLGCVVDDGTPGSSSLGNGLATLIGDFALSHGLEAAGTLGTQETVQLARLARTVFEGAMAEADDTWALNRTAERYLAAAGDYAGSVHAHAAALGARLSGRDDAAHAMSEYGQNVGIATKISNDLLALFLGDDATARSPGNSLRHGDYTLPAIYALAEDPTLGELLAANEIENSVDDALARIGSSRAIERCIANCDEFAAAAIAALTPARLPDTAALRQLARLPSDRCRRRLHEHAIENVD